MTAGFGLGFIGRSKGHVATLIATLVYTGNFWGTKLRTGIGSVGLTRCRPWGSARTNMTVFTQPF